MRRKATIESREKTRDDLAAWLRRIGAELDRVDLELTMGAAEDARALYVCAWCPGRDPAAVVAAEIRAAAAAHGELAAGPIVYRLTATAPTGDVLGAVPVRVAGPHASGPSATGAPADLLATAHRHLEAQASINMRLLTASADAIRAIAEQARLRASEDAEELRWHRERSKAVRIEAEELARERIEVDAARELDLEREKRTSRLIEQGAAAIMPVIARRLTAGSGPVPARETAKSSSDIDKIRSAWGHLSPETVDRIVDELPPDVAMTLAATLAPDSGDPDGTH